VLLPKSAVANHETQVLLPKSAVANHEIQVLLPNTKHKCCCQKRCCQTRQGATCNKQSKAHLPLCNLRVWDGLVIGMLKRI